MEKVDTQALRTVIRSADADWAKAAADKNGEAFTSFVAENGSVLPPNTTVLEGPEAVKKCLSEMMASKEPDYVPRARS